MPYDWQHKIPSHYAYRNPVGSDPQAIIAASVAALRAKIAELGAERVAAFYAEPIQGSGGVFVPPTGWLKAMHAVCKENDILFVADEVITAFGRTGPYFASEDEGIVPDFITVAKGLTSGYVPMGAVLMTDDVYDTLADGAGKAAVGHGFTYSAHPVSAAVALECLRLYEEGLLENGRKAGPRLMAGFMPLPIIRWSARSVAAACWPRSSWSPTRREDALAASSRAGTSHLRSRLGQWPGHPRLQQRRSGLCPPLCCTEDDIDGILERTRLTLDQTLEDKDVRAAMKGLTAARAGVARSLSGFSPSPSYWEKIASSGRCAFTMGDFSTT